MIGLTLGLVQTDNIRCNNSGLEKGIFGKLKVELLLAQANLPDTTSSSYQCANRKNHSKCSGLIQNRARRVLRDDDVGDLCKQSCLHFHLQLQKEDTRA